LTEAGHPPILCPAAVLGSQFPTSVAAANTQRERWERGHIGLILSAAPALLLRAIARREWKLLALTLDMTIPPLSLLAMLVLTMFGSGVIYVFLELSLLPLVASTIAAVIFT